MNNKIILPELKNPINSNYNTDSGTVGLACIIAFAIIAVIMK